MIEVTNKPPSHTPIQRLLAAARTRALKKGLEFSITEEDIHIPEVCPILGVELKLGSRHSHDQAPSIDRIRSEEGYVPGNVQIISHKANRLKGNKSQEEFEEELANPLRVSEVKQVFKVPPGFEFKDKMGRWRTASLFIDCPQQVDPDAGYRPLYSLKGHDHPDGYPSLRRLYLEISDPTEYRVATSLFGGWEHWLALTERSPWFKSILASLRSELEIKLRSEALLQLIEDSKSSSRSSKGSAKYIADGDYKEKKAGRPTKADIEEARVTKLGLDKRVSDDMARLGLAVIDNTSA